MRVALFIPCFVDHYFPNVGISMVKILERLGHEVTYPEGQTCCGQPPFNTGYHDEARDVAVRLFELFRKCDVVVSASGSCGAMIKVFNPELFAGTPHEEDALSLSRRTWEFSSFLVDHLHVTDVHSRFPHTITFHDGCHGLRELGLKQQARKLLSHVEGLSLVEMQEAETCCGFGGTFSVKYPAISSSMAEVKCESILATGAEYVVSNDSSCLMQIQGTLDHSGHPVKSLHLAEVLVQQ